MLHGTLPLLDSFRITHLYATLALIGIALLAGAGAERLAALPRGVLAPFVAGAAVFLLALGGACFALYDEFVPGATFVFPAAALVAVVGLRGLRRSGWIPAALLVVLLAEIAVLRLPLHDFVDVRVVEMPPPIVRTLLERHPGQRTFRLANVPHFFSYVGFASASAPDLERLAGLFLSSMDAGSNLLWSIPSVNGNLALSLARRQVVEPLITAEVRGETPRLPGRRFIDGFGVRYAVVHKQHRGSPFARDFEEVYFDEDFRFYLLENLHAAPRMRFVASSDARPVANARAAVAEMMKAGEGALYVEADGSAFPPDGGDPVRPAASLVTGLVAPERYVAILDVQVPGFLVIADAMYPGWQALVNGEPAPLFAANGLEKAVPLGAGRVHVEVLFAPASFRTGARVTISSLVLALGLLGFSAGARLRRLGRGDADAARELPAAATS